MKNISKKPIRKRYGDGGNILQYLERPVDNLSTKKDNLTSSLPITKSISKIIVPNPGLQKGSTLVDKNKASSKQLADLEKEQAFLTKAKKDSGGLTEVYPEFDILTMGNILKPLVKTAVSKVYKINPFAEKLVDKNAFFRVAGEDSYKDALESGVVRSGDGAISGLKFKTSDGLEHQIKRPTGFPSFQKGYAEMGYRDKNMANYIYKSEVPMFKRGEINPVTNVKIGGRHYAHRPIDITTGETITQLPIENVKIFGENPHWLKGYQEVSKFKEDIMKPKRKKYAGGTAITNYIEDPSEALAQNQINIAKAKYESASNPWILGLKGVGGAMMGVGEAMGGFSGLGLDKNVASGLDFLTKGVASLAGGGTVKSQVPVEVEGDEVGEMPNGQLFDFQGPSHEAGGIDTTLPEGTEIYSKRIQIDGKTMADRKKARESIVSRYTKKSDKGDFVAGNSLKRIKVATEREEAFDKSVQDAIGLAMGTKSKSLIGREKHELGNTVGQVPYEGETKEEYYNRIGDTQSYTPGTLNPPIASGEGGDGFQFTGGDFLNMAGNIFQGVAPYLNTLKSRATDTPNINPYKGYGQDGINKLAEGEQFLRQTTDESLKSLTENRSSQMSQNRKTARGVNSMRALDLATYEGANKQEGDIYANYANSMLNLTGREAQAEDMQDRQVMMGEGQRDNADRQDKGAFESAVSEGLRSLGMTTANVGKELNQAKTRDTMYGLLQTDQFKFNPATNSIIGKAITNSGMDFGDMSYPDVLKKGWDANPELRTKYGNDYAAFLKATQLMEVSGTPDTQMLEDINSAVKSAKKH